MAKNTAKPLFSLMRLSLFIGVIGLLVLAGGIGLQTQSNYQELAELLRVLGAILIGISIAGLVIDRRRQIYGFSQTRQARFGANAVLLTLSFMGIVVLINYLAHRHPQRWDLTENKSFTLSDQSIKILKNLKDKVKITAFYTLSNPLRQDVSNLLETYREQAGDKLDVKIVDPERQPGLALRYGISSDSIILEKGTLRKTVTGTQEQDLTNALLAITREKKPVIYFLQGHGELDPEDFDLRKGLSGIKQALEAENYQVSRLFLQASGGKVPTDAAALIIAGPETPLTAPERQAIQEYLDQRGGRVLLSFKPRVQTGLESMVSKYGVQVGQDLVIDPGRNIQNDVSSPAITEYSFHPITKDLMRTITFFPLVRTVQLKNPPEGVNGTELFKSSSASWAERNLKENSLVRKDPGDAQGPLSLAVALTINHNNKANQDKQGKTAQDKVQEKPKESRLVIFGNAIFASNGFARLLGNADLFLNSIAWLAEQEDLISIRAKETINRQIELTNQQSQLVFYISVLGMPLLVLLMGAWVFWQRR